MTEVKEVKDTGDTLFDSLGPEGQAALVKRYHEKIALRAKLSSIPIEEVAEILKNVSPASTDEVAENMKAILMDHKMMKEEPQCAAEHQHSVILILRYCEHERFKEYLKSVGIAYTADMIKDLSLPQLEGIISRIRHSLDVKQPVTFHSDFINSSVKAVETLTATTPSLKEQFDVTGLSEFLKGNDRLQDVLAQMSLDSQFDLSPRGKVLFELASGVAAVVSMNAMKKQIKAKAAEKAEEKKWIAERRERIRKEQIFSHTCRRDNEVNHLRDAGASQAQIDLLRAKWDAQIAEFESDTAPMLLQISASS